LKNNFSWQDKKDINHESKDGSMSPDGLTSEQRVNRIQQLLEQKDSE
jgi:hypothetical protein